MKISKTCLKTALAVIAMMGISSCAFAAQPGFYLGGQLGYSFQNFASGANSSSSNNGLGYVADLGYNFNQYLGAELGYQYIHNATQSTVTSKYQDVYFAGKLSYPLLSNFDVHGKLGGAFVDNDQIDSSGVLANLSTNSIRPFLSAGTSYYFTSHLAADLDYSYVVGNASVPPANLLGLGVSVHF